MHFVPMQSEQRKRDEDKCPNCMKEIKRKGTYSDNEELKSSSLLAKGALDGGLGLTFCSCCLSSSLFQTARSCWSCSGAVMEAVLLLKVVVVVRKGFAVVAGTIMASEDTTVASTEAAATGAWLSSEEVTFLLDAAATNACQTGPRTRGVTSLLSKV